MDCYNSPMAKLKTILEIIAKNYWIIFFYLLVFLVLLNNSFSYLDVDLGWHLATGKRILETMAVPTINNENFSLAGTSWVDHEWLINLFSYLIYNFTGYVCLTIFFSGLAITFLVLQLFFTKRFFLEKGYGWTFFFIFQFLGLWASLPHLGIRMQEIGLVNLILLFIIIYSYNKKQNWKILFWLPLLFFFWASMHASFLIGLFFLGLFFIIRLAEKFLERKLPLKLIDFSFSLPFKKTFIFGIFSVFSFLATCITPYGVKLYSFLLGYQNSQLSKNIEEWFPQYYLPLKYWQLTYLTLAGLAGAFFLIEIIFNYRKDLKYKIKLWEASYLIILFVLSFKARRHFPLFFIVSTPLLAKFLSDYLYSEKLDDFIKKIFIRQTIRSFWKWLLLIIYFICLIYGFSRINFVTDPWNNYQDNYPVEAIKFLRAHPEYDNLKMFNDYNFGGYLEWVWPERKIFIDGRLPQYQINGHSMIAEYHEFSEEGKTKEALEKYDIGIVFIGHPKPLPKINSWEKDLLGFKDVEPAKEEKNYSFDKYLDESGEWKIVYNDSLCEIYVKISNLSQK